MAKSKKSRFELKYEKMIVEMVGAKGRQAKLKIIDKYCQNKSYAKWLYNRIDR